jgi:hypothetical protein
MSLIETDAAYEARYKAWERIVNLMIEAEGIDAEIMNMENQI